MVNAMRLFRTGSFYMGISTLEGTLT